MTTTIAALMAALTVSLAAPGWAQVGSGALTGVVADSSGAALPAALVTARAVATGLVRETVTGPAGEHVDHPGGPATHFVRVRRTDGGWVSTGGGGSHLIAGIAAADALAVLEPGASVPPGGPLTLMPLWT